MSQSQQQIKRLLAKEVSNLNAQCVASLSIGFLGIVFVPFLYPKIDNPIHITINLLGITGGLGLGAYCLSKCSHLDESAGKLKALDNLEKNLLKREWALQHQQRLNYLESVQQTPTINVSSTEVARTSTTSTSMTEVSENQDIASTSDTSTSDTSTSDTSTSLTPEVEVVADALASGFSDTQIIENILGYRGRKYNEGKEILESIKAIIIE